MGLTTHTHTQRPTSALWSFFQIGEGILEKKKSSFGQNGSDKTQTEAHMHFRLFLEPQNLIETKLVWLPVLSTVRGEVVSYLQKNVHRVLVNIKSIVVTEAHH